MRTALSVLVVGLVAFCVIPPADAQLDLDPRAERPQPPVDLETLADRFLAGYDPLTSPGAVTLAAGETYTFSQSVEAGVCYAAAAVTSEADLDLRVRRSGALVTQDVRLDSYPVATWCAATSGTARIELRAFNASAEVSYAVFVDRDARDAAAGGLDELSNRLSRAIARSAPRWEPIGTQWRTTFSRPEVRTWSVDAAADRCYAVVAVGQAAVEDVDLLLVDEEGFERARDFALDAVPLVSYCPDRAEVLTVHVALRQGRGVVAAQLLEHPR